MSSEGRGPDWSLKARGEFWAVWLLKRGPIISYGKWVSRGTHWV